MKKKKPQLDLYGRRVYFLAGYSNPIRWRGSTAWMMQWPATILILSCQSLIFLFFFFNLWQIKLWIYLMIKWHTRPNKQSPCELALLPTITHTHTPLQYFAHIPNHISVSLSALFGFYFLCPNLKIDFCLFSKSFFYQRLYLLISCTICGSGLLLFFSFLYL